MSNVFYAIVLTCVLSCVYCAPVISTEEVQKGTSYEPYMDHKNFDVVYDQRQNGTENFKVNLSKVVLFLAPSQPLLPSLSLLDSQQLVSPFRNAGKENGKHQKNDGSPAKGAAKSRVQSRTSKRKYTLPMLLKAFIPIEIRRNSNGSE